MKLKKIVLSLLPLMLLTACDTTSNSNNPDPSNNVEEPENVNNDFEFDTCVKNLGDNYSLEVIERRNRETKNYYFCDSVYVYTYKMLKNDNLRIFDCQRRHVDYYTFYLSKFMEENYPERNFSDENLIESFLFFNNKVFGTGNLSTAIAEGMQLTKVEEGVYSCEYCNSVGGVRENIFLETPDKLVTRKIIFGPVGNALVGYQNKTYEQNLFETFDEAITDSYNLGLSNELSFNTLSKNAVYDENSKSYKVSAEQNPDTKEIVFNGNNPMLTCEFFVENNNFKNLFCTVVGEGTLECRAFDVGKTTVDLPETEIVCEHSPSYVRLEHQLIDGKWYHIEKCNSCSHLLKYSEVDPSTGICSVCGKDLLLQKYEPIPLLDDYVICINYNCATKVIKSVNFKFIGTGPSIGRVMFTCYGMFEGDTEYQLVDKFDECGKKGNYYYIIQIGDVVYFPHQAELISRDYDEKTQMFIEYYKFSDFYRDSIVINKDICDA